MSAAQAPISGLFARVYRDMLADQTELPALPDVALRIRAAMQQPHYSATTVARVIGADPSTSAYLLRVANSALYRGVTPVENVENAVTRLGMDSTRNLVTAHALRAMFKTRSPHLSRLMRATWRNSARVAALAFVIAKHCPGFSPDRALLAGLLQDIGVLPLLNALERSDGALPDPARITDTLEVLAPKAGGVLLKHWEFEPDIVEVARSRGDWWRISQPGPDLADLVMVAHLHARVGGEDMHELPLITELPAFVKLPLADLGPSESLAFLKAAEADIQELLRMLGV